MERKKDPSRKSNRVVMEENKKDRRTGRRSSQK